MLAKGLERIQARRFAYKAIQAGVLNPQHIGAQTKRSAIDLVFTLVHRIEAQLALGKTCVLVTNDVKGAFDSVLHGRQVLRLRAQGWSPEEIR